MNGQAPEVAFVTGTGSGIVAAVVRRPATRGASVALFGLAKDKRSRPPPRSGRREGRALALHGDVGDDSAVGQAVTETVTHLGALTATVACAGNAVTGTVSAISLAD